MGRHLENFYLLNQDIGEAIARDYAAEARQLKVSGERFAGDIRWNASKRKGWEFVGLPEFLNPEKWWEPRDYEQMGNTAKKYHHRVRDTLGLKVEKISNGQIFGEFMHQIALELETKQVDGQKWKYRRISPDSWRFAQMYLAHKQAMKVAKEPSPEVAAVPEIDSIVLMLVDYLPQAQTREQCEELFVTVNEQQKSEAWAMLEQEEQQRISALFEIQAIQPTIFEQSSTVTEELEVKTQAQPAPITQEVSVVSTRAIAVEFPVENQSHQSSVISYEPMNTQAISENPLGHSCQVWHFGEWRRAIIQSWDDRPHEKFFESVVSFVESSFTRHIWQREAILLEKQLA